MNLQTFQSKDEFIKESVRIIAEICNTPQETITIALSGGSTPGPIYQELAKQNLPFKKIKFFQVDERYIPEDHSDSNCRMIYETLIQQSSPKAFHYFDTSHPSQNL